MEEVRLDSLWMIMTWSWMNMYLKPCDQFVNFPYEE